MAGEITIMEKFSRGPNIYGQNIQVGDNIGGGTAAAATTVTSSIANFLIGLTNFENLNERDIYEQLYIWEPEIASTVTKVSEMVRSSFDYFHLIDDTQIDNIPDSLIIRNDDDEVMDYGATPAPENLRDEMKDTANEIARVIDVSSIFETWAAILYTYGELYLEKNDNLSLTVLPNNRITIVDDLSIITGMQFNMNHVITEENYLIIDERLQTQRELKKGQFIHIKLSDIPLNIKDIKGRSTFGIYGISPLQRCIVPIWMKRQLYIIETLWRWANVPREHHTVAAEAFNLALFPGTPEQKRTAAEGALRSFINNYSAQLKQDVPDQKYVTSSNIEIKNIEHSGSSYMQSNELLKQIDDSIWDGVGMPKSVIRGMSDGSYASELVVSSGASLRIEQIARKIARVVLDNMRERLLKLNADYPVRHLDIKVSFELADSKLEQAKIAQLKKDIGLYTQSEIREVFGDAPLTEQQVREEGLVTTGNTMIVKSLEDIDYAKIKANEQKLKEKQMEAKQVNSTFGGINGKRSNGSTKSPDTPKSSNQKSTDKGDAVSHNVEKKTGK